MIDRPIYIWTFPTL
jgi:hypothetical protein